MGASYSNNTGSGFPTHSTYDVNFRDLSFHLEASPEELADIVLNAAICSHAVYAETCTEVEACLREWAHFGPRTRTIVGGFQKIMLSRTTNDTVYTFLAAYTPDTVYVAFRGSPNRNNTPVDFMEVIKNANFGSIRGRKQIGYSMNTKIFDYVPLSCITEGIGDNRRIVFCGHSMGGAIAHSVLLHYLLRTVVPTRQDYLSCKIPHSMFSVTFGSPHFCNDSTARWLWKEGLGKRFISVVNRDDPVPCLMEDLRVPSYSSNPFQSPDNQILPLHQSTFAILSQWLNICEMRDEEMVHKFLREIKRMRQKITTKSKTLPLTERFYAPAGVFVHLTLGVEVMENISCGHLCVEPTLESLDQHMLLGPEGYASQLMQLIHGNSDWKTSIVDRSNQSSVNTIYLPLVMQPKPVIDQAVYEGRFEKGRATITLHGRNLFFLLEKPMVYQECVHCNSREEMYGNWKIIQYSSSGTTLKLVADIPQADAHSMTLCHEESLTIEIVTAFGSVSSPVFGIEPSRESFMGFEMWRQSLQVLSLIRRHLLEQPNQLNLVQKALVNLAILAKVEDYDLNSTIFGLQNAVKSSPEEFLEAMHPLMDAVFYYTGAQWDFETEFPLVESLPVGTCVSHLYGGEVVNVEEGYGVADVSVVDPSMFRRSPSIPASGDDSSVESFHHISTLKKSRIVRHTNRRDILQLLLAFVHKHGESASDDSNLTDAEIEAEVVASAMELEVRCGTGDDTSDSAIEATIKWARLTNPNTVLSRDATANTRQEAICRIRILISVYRLFTLLKLHRHTFVAVVGNENAGKTTLVDVVGRHFRRHFNVDKIPCDEIGKKVNTWEIRAYHVREDLWLVDFPGLNSRNAQYRKHADTIFDKFRHVAHAVVVVASMSLYRDLSELALMSRVRKMAPLDGNLLLVVNGCDRYKHKITGGQMFVEKRRALYCQDSKLRPEDVLFTVLKYDLDVSPADSILMAKFPESGILDPWQIANRIGKLTK